MAAMASLLKASSFVNRDSKHLPLPLKWRRINPLLRTTQISLPSSINKSSTTTTPGFIRTIKCSSRGGSDFRVQCVTNSKNCFKKEEEEEEYMDRKSPNHQNPFERFAQVMLKALQQLYFTATLLCVRLVYDICCAISVFPSHQRRRMGGGPIQFSLYLALGLILFFFVTLFMVVFGFGSVVDCECFPNSKNCFKEEKQVGENQNPFVRFGEMMLKVLKALEQPVASVILLWILLTKNPAIASSRTAIFLEVMLAYDLYKAIWAFSSHSRRRMGGRVKWFSSTLGFIFIPLLMFMWAFGFAPPLKLSPCWEGSVPDTQKSTKLQKLLADLQKLAQNVKILEESLGILKSHTENLDESNLDMRGNLLLKVVLLKLQDDLQKLEQKIEFHEESLRTLKSNLDESILDIQATRSARS